MLIELLLKPLFWLVGLIIGLVPTVQNDFDLSGIGGLIDFLAFGFQVFPVSLFVIIIGNVCFWLTAQLVWAIVEWVYKKFPGIN